MNRYDKRASCPQNGIMFIYLKQYAQFSYVINPYFLSVYFGILNNVSNYIFKVSPPFMGEYF